MSKTLTFTDGELALLHEGMAVLNDIKQDCALDNLSVDLFPSGNQVIHLDKHECGKLRKEIEDNITQLVTLRGLMDKLGLEVKDTGYSV